MAERLERLTEKQREVLRLVSRGQTSKEIARTLAAQGQPISKDSVDKRIEAAVRAVGAADRRQLAEWLRLSEAGVAYDPMAPDPESLPSAADDRAAEPLPTITARLKLIAATAWRARPNDLTTSERLGLMILRFGLFAAGAAALVWAMRPD